MAEPELIDNNQAIRDAAPGRKPELLCIGAQKAGTSWLHETLRQHPDVWVAPFKELHFFDHKFIDECRKWAPWHVKRGVRNAREAHFSEQKFPDREYLDYLKQIETWPMFNGQWYKYVYSRAPKTSICMDVTPEYSCLPDEGVEFVSKFLPRTKFVYIVRDPVARAVSQLKMNIARKKLEFVDLESWVAAVTDDPVLYSRGDYSAYVPRWEKAFTADRLLFVPYGDLSSNPLAVLKSVEELARLTPHTSYSETSKRIHSSPDIHVPPEAVAIITARVARQRKFIKDHFGDDFELRCR